MAGPTAGRISASSAPLLLAPLHSTIVFLRGVPVTEICRKAGISQATYFNWKKKYDGLLPTEMRRLKQLEDENAKLKKLVADLSLDKEMLQDVIRRKL
jgi:putative transposase